MKNIRKGKGIKMNIDYLIEQYSLHKDDKIVYSEKIKSEDTACLFLHKEYFDKDYNEAWVIKTLGRKWKSNIANLMSFIDIYKYITYNPENHDGYVNPIAISQTSELLTDLFGNHQNVSNVIKLAKKVELLKVVDDNYQFNAYYEEMNCSKRYILNKDIQDIIINISNNNKIIYKKYKISNIIYNSANIRDLTENSELFDKVRIYSDVRIANPYGDDRREDFETRINILLEQKYPQLVVLKEEANWINEQPFYLEHPELQVRVKPHFKYSRGGLISKIGLRATNRIVSMKEHENGKDSGKIWRKDYLKKIFGKDYQSFDIKASIYQLTHALNTNVWLDNKVDMYAEIYGDKFETKELRDKFKSLCMPLYFDKSDRKAVHHLSEKTGLDKEAIYQTVVRLRTNMLNALGGRTYDSEIFLHESVIYNHVTMELIKFGWNIVQVYDGFYGKNKEPSRSLEKDISMIIDSYIYQYITKYISII